MFVRHKTIKNILVNHRAAVVSQHPARFILCEMREIKLKHSDRVALVSDEDYEYLNQFTWYCSHERHCYYAVSHKSINNYPIPARMHRVIMEAQGGQMIDHIDGNGLNNQRNNLRFVDYAQNMWNRSVNKGRLYKGVTDNRDGTFSAYITHNKTRHYLGSFKTPEDAAIAYNSAAVIYRGEFARLNVVNILPLQYKLMAISQ